jgi:DNA-binding CsgD family transcriptional regulator
MRGSGFFFERHLSQGHWANISAELARWYSYNYDRASQARRRHLRSQIIPIITRIMDEKLTARQHEVMSLRFWEDQTQAQIAERLAISQPTVNQHLTGKRRDGKKIGGAVQKIRKAVRKEAARGETDGTRMLTILVGLLDTGESRSHRLRASGQHAET